MNRQTALTALNGLGIVFLIGAFAWMNSRLQSVVDGQEDLRTRLAAVERSTHIGGAPSAHPTAAGPTPMAAVQDPEGFARPEDVAALRRDLTELRRRLDGRPSAIEETIPGEGGATVAAVSAEPTADSLRQLVQEVIEERERNRMKSMTANASNYRVERRKKLLDDLEKRLSLSAFQKEAIGKVVESNEEMNIEMKVKALDGPGLPVPSPEDLARRATETEEKVKSYLTPQQAAEYDDWKKQTGGFGGMAVFVMKSGDATFVSGTVEKK